MIDFALLDLCSAHRLRRTILVPGKPLIGGKRFMKVISVLVTSCFAALCATTALAEAQSTGSKKEIHTYIKSGGMCNALPTLAECAACARAKGYAPAYYMTHACKGKS